LGISPLEFTGSVLLCVILTQPQGIKGTTYSLTSKLNKPWATSIGASFSQMAGPGREGSKPPEGTQLTSVFVCRTRGGYELLLIALCSTSAIEQQGCSFHSSSCS
jgi:hypothetical protein